MMAEKDMPPDGSVYIEGNRKSVENAMEALAPHGYEFSTIEDHSEDESRVLAKLPRKEPKSS